MANPPLNGMFYVYILNLLYIEIYTSTFTFTVQYKSTLVCRDTLPVYQRCCAKYFIGIRNQAVWPEEQTVPMNFAALIFCNFHSKILWRHNGRNIFSKNLTKYMFAEDHLVIKNVNFNSQGIYSCHEWGNRRNNIGSSEVIVETLRELILIICTLL